MDPSIESSESNRRNAGGMIERYDSGDQSDQRNRAPESQEERERDFERRKWKIIKERNEKLKTEKILIYIKKKLIIKINDCI